MTTTQTTTLQLAPSVFARTIGAALIAASTDATRHHLAAVMIQTTGEHLEMVTTDSYRLNLVEIPNDTPASPPALIARTDAAALVKMAKDYAKTTKDKGPEMVLNIDHDAHEWTATAGPATLAGRLILADFPPYRSIIPTEYTAETGTYFDAGFLADIGKTAATLCTRTTGARVVCVNMPNRKPSLWKITTHDAITCTVLLMPQRP